MRYQGCDPGEQRHRGLAIEGLGHFFGRGDYFTVKSTRKKISILVGLG